MSSSDITDTAHKANILKLFRLRFVLRHQTYFLNDALAILIPPCYSKRW